MVMNYSGETLVYERNQVVFYSSGQVIMPISPQITAQYKSASTVSTQKNAITEIESSRNILESESINFYTGNFILVRNQIDVEFLQETRTLLNNINTDFKKSQKISFQKNDLVILQEDTTLLFKSPGLITITEKILGVVKKKVIGKCSKVVFEAGTSVQVMLETVI
jgi:hypothetical protein